MSQKEEITQYNSPTEITWDDFEEDLSNGLPPAELTDKLVEWQINEHGAERLEGPCHEVLQFFAKLTVDCEFDFEWMALWRASVARRQPGIRVVKDDVIEGISSGADPEDNDDTQDEPEYLNDAVLTGEGGPEWDALMDTEITVTFGKIYSKRQGYSTKDDAWVGTKGPWGQLIEGQQGNNAAFAKNRKATTGLSRHVESDEKEGSGLVLGSCNTYRRANSVTSVCGFGYDLDSGDLTPEEVWEIVERENFAAILNTTHSHMTSELEFSHTEALKYGDITDDTVRRYLTDKKKYAPEIVASATVTEECAVVPSGWVVRVKTNPIPKSRLFVPFAEGDVQLIELAKTLPEAQDIVKRKLLGFAEKLGIKTDPATVDISRFFYSSRHTKGAEHQTKIHRAPPTKFSDVPMVESTKTTNGKKFNRRPDVVTKDGLDVSVLYDRYGKRWMPAAMAEDAGLETTANVSNSGGKVHVHCPFADGHTDSSDDGATFAINAEDSETEFAIVKCLHGSCTHRHTVDFFGAWIDNGDLDPATLEDPKYLMPFGDDQPEESHFRLTPDEQIAASKDTATVKAEIDSFDNDTPAAEIRGYLKSLLKGGADVDTVNRAKIEIASKTMLGLSDLNPIIREIRTAAKKQKKHDAVGDSGPVIDLSQPFPRNSEAVFKTMIDQGDEPEIFHSNERLVDIQNDQNGNANIRTIEKDRYKAKVEGRMVFAKTDKEGNAHFVEAPSGLVNNAYQQPKTEYPPLHRIISAPVFASDKTLIVEPGYHDSGVYYHPSKQAQNLEGVSLEPTDAEVCKAVWRLADLFGDFSLGAMTREQLVQAIEDGDDVPEFCHLTSSGLTPLCRDFINGPTPGHLGRKDKPRTGATKVLSTMQYIATLTHASPQALPEKDEEVRKTITAELDEGSPSVFFDNLKENVNCGVLAAAMTAYPTFKGRRLGVTEMVNAEVKTTWLLTGNRTQLSTELTDRSLLIKLDPQMERPGDRGEKDFKYYPIEDHVEKHVAEYLHCLLTLVQNWIAKGCPTWEGRPLGGFEVHSRIIGGILEAAGINGFLANREELTRTVRVSGPEDNMFDAMIERHHLTPQSNTGTLFRACNDAGTAKTRTVADKSTDNEFANHRVLSIMDILTVEGIALPNTGYAQDENGCVFYTEKSKQQLAQKISGMVNAVREWRADREEEESRQGRYVLKAAYQDKHSVLYQLEQLPLAKG